MEKWICSHCHAVNPRASFECHNCPNTCGNEEWYAGGLIQMKQAIQELEKRVLSLERKTVGLERY